MKLRDDHDLEENGFDVRKLPVKKRKEEPAVTAKTKWSWKDEYVEALIGYRIKDHKTLCPIDFEADLNEMYYSAVHRSIVCRFPSEFGSENVTGPSTCVKEMPSEQ